MTAFDISHTVLPDSDQLDAIDLEMSGPRVFSIERVSKGNAEQPVQIHLAGFPRPWRPGKSMRRILLAVWGADASTYVGRRLKLWCDPKVVYGGAAVGGVRILAMSHIDKRKAVPLLISRGKSAMYTVDPLPDDERVMITAGTLSELIATFVRKGIAADAQLAGVNRLIGRSASDLDRITEDEAQRVITYLQQRPDIDAETGEVTPPDDGPNLPADSALPLGDEPAGWKS